MTIEEQDGENWSGHLLYWIAFDLSSAYQEFFFGIRSRRSGREFLEEVYDRVNPGVVSRLRRPLSQIIGGVGGIDLVHALAVDQGPGRERIL